MWGIMPFGFALLLIQGWIMGTLAYFQGELIFKVDGHYHQQGRVLGKADMNKARCSYCTWRRRAPFLSDEKVVLDGAVSQLLHHRSPVKTAVILREGLDGLSPHSWGSKGVKKTATVTGTHEPQQGQGDVAPSQSVSSPDVLVFPAMWFPQSSSGSLRRRKRDWVIPPINIPENDRGPFPKTMVQIRSSNAKKLEITYSITGPGANQSPEGIFTIDKRSGMLFVTKPLDREKKDSYMLLAYAVAVGIGQAEEPMELIIRVTDQNDNKPEFTHNPFLGHVTEGALPDSAFMKVTAIDKDDPSTDNGIVRYKIASQEPQLPSPSMFTINAVSGVVSVAAPGLDREAYPEYKLIIQGADMEGIGLSNTCTAIVTVTDSNDNAPRFVESNYSGSVRENEKGELVLTMAVRDEDEPHTPAWSTKYTIIKGNEGGLFSVHTGPGKMEGLITTARGLDFENKNKHTLLVTVENEAPFVTRLPTSTATVIVNVEDVNEAPVFTPAKKVTKVPEDSTVGSALTEYAAKDPDSAMKQTVRFQIENDPARWLTVNKKTGLISVNRPMDRESSFVKDGKYKATILAYDDDVIPATGTGTLIIDLDDVNDNSPLIDQREVSVCNEQPEAARLNVIDADGPGNTGPFDVELLGASRNNWTAKVNSTSGSVIDLTLRKKLDPGEYHVLLRIYDVGRLFQDSTVSAEVCQCKGRVSTCVRQPPSPLTDGPLSIGVLGAILGLLLLVLLLLMFMRRRSRLMKKEPLLHDDVRDNLYYYDEEGGGEDDQEYDLSQLHRGLDNRPGVFRNDVAPTLVTVPLYRLRPEENEEIGNFIEDNLKAADGDPTAPPYDSLLVFDNEGGGSEAGSLSSLNSSSSGDQDYDCLGEWGPRFKKLADMYCSWEHCDSDTLPSKVVWV